MRLFSAVALPADIRAALMRLSGGLPDVRWVEPDDYHLTLAFFGDIDADVAEDLAEALAAIDMPPFDITLTGLGTFGTGSPRAIVALATRDLSLLALEAKHRAIITRLGIPEGARKYTPHVTLARLRRIPAPTVADWMSTRPVFEKLTWRVDAFSLFSSATSRGGGPYVAEQTFPLLAKPSGDRSSARR
jgi:2'-5' RNA ligase